MKFVIGSASLRKVEVAQKVIAELFGNVVHAGESVQPIEVVGYAAKSGVPETPYDKETFEGAHNRALDAQDNVQGADCYIGLESGLVERYDNLYEEAWCVVLWGGKKYYGYSSGLTVPHYVVQKMEERKLPHCDVMGLIEKEFDKTPNDTWGTYTGGLLLRTVSLEEALRNALIQVAATSESLYLK